MAEPATESSVQFNLAELMRIEQARVDDEQRQRAQKQAAAQAALVARAQAAEARRVAMVREAERREQVAAAERERRAVELDRAMEMEPP